MQIVNQTAFEVAPIAGRLEYPKHSITVIVKGTFDLHPGIPATLADVQLPLSGDEFYEDDEEMTGSPKYESDLAHFKPRCDLCLVGKCHVPGGEARRRCEVTFAVGDTARTLVVFGDRRWRSGLIGLASTPEPFTEMDLRYENGFGGRGYKKNHVGKGYRRIKDEKGKGILPLPNVEDPKARVNSSLVRRDPAGFAPLSRVWQPRVSMIGKYGWKWLATRGPWYPENMDWSVFNAAPAAMQVDSYLRGDEKVILENLHRTQSEYRTALPGIRVRSFLNRLSPTGSAAATGPAAPEFVEVEMNLDTLWIDAETETLVLVWRGNTEVVSEEFEDVVDLVVVSETLADSAKSPEQWRACLEESLAVEEPAPEVPAAAALASADDDSEMVDALATIEAQMAKHMAMFGIDPAKPPPPNPATELLLKEMGAAEEDAPAAVDGGQLEDHSWTRELVEEHLARGPGESEDSRNFQGADLRDLDMSGLDLTSRELVGADLSGAMLAGTVLAGANLTGARLVGARMTGADLQFACLDRADLREADLGGSKLQGASLKDGMLDRVKGVELDMTGADLTGVEACQADFSRACFAGVIGPESIWYESDLSGADFSEADMEGADFTKTQLGESDFRRSKMKGTNFRRANLRGASLLEMNGFHANLECADLTRADLSGANMFGASFLDAVLDDMKTDGANLKRVMGLQR